MENPLIAGFVEIQHEPKTWAWSGKTTEGQASPSDCHKTAIMMSDEEFLIENLSLFYGPLESGLKFFIRVDLYLNFNDDGVM